MLVIFSVPKPRILGAVRKTVYDTFPTLGAAKRQLQDFVGIKWHCAKALNRMLIMVVMSSRDITKTI